MRMSLMRQRDFKTVGTIARQVRQDSWRAKKAQVRARNTDPGVGETNFTLNAVGPRGIDSQPELPQCGMLSVLYSKCPVTDRAADFRHMTGIGGSTATTLRGKSNTVEPARMARGEPVGARE